MIEPVPCKKCGAKPRILCIDGLYYVQCTGTLMKRRRLAPDVYDTYHGKCDKWGPHEFLATSQRVGIQNWNYANSTRTGGFDD